MANVIKDLHADECLTSQIPAHLEITTYADHATILSTASELRIGHGPRPIQMHGADATGISLVSNGAIGADIIRLPAGQGFAPHTHPGHHILAVLGGEGTITYDGYVYGTRAGQIYLVEGLIPHAVGATTDHVILAIGSPHRAVDAADRMALVDYAAVTSSSGDINCLICSKTARMPTLLHDEGCPHCPCEVCAYGEEALRNAEALK